MELKETCQLIGSLSLVVLLPGLFSLLSGPSSLRHLPAFIPQTGRGIFGHFQIIGAFLVIIKTSGCFWPFHERLGAFLGLSLTVFRPDYILRIYVFRSKSEGSFPSFFFLSFYFRASNPKPVHEISPVPHTSIKLRSEHSQPFESVLASFFASCS